jgi:hypothetical protein
VLSGLPDSFVEAMRKLFNLLDVEGHGRIRFEGPSKCRRPVLESVSKCELCKFQA